MVQAFVITLREGLEMALITVIVLAYLAKTSRRALFSRIWQGVALGAAVSIAAGAVLFAIGGELEGRAEQVFEGSTLMFAAIVLTWMVLWMKSQARSVKGHIETRVEAAAGTGSGYALMSLAFVLIAREGLETSLFIFSASKTSTPVATSVGAVAGLVAVVALGRVIYRGSRRLNLKMFFQVTGVMLIVFGAGLVVRGISEFQEARLLPEIVDHVWNTNSVMDDRSGAGAFLRGLFGYHGDPSLLEVIVYPLYLSAALWFFLGFSTQGRAPQKQAGAGT